MRGINRSWLPLFFGLTGTLLWLAAGAWYIDNAVGWSSLVYLLPQEVAQMALGLSAPLIVLWLGISVAGRKTARSEQTRDIVTRVEALLAAAVRGQAGENRLAAAIKEETEALAAAGDAAAEKLRPLLDSLEQKHQDLALMGGETRQTLQGLAGDLEGRTVALSRDSTALKQLLLESQALLATQGETLADTREEAEVLVASLRESFSGIFEGLGDSVAETAAQGDKLLDQMTLRQAALAAELDRLGQAGSAMGGSVKQEAQDLARVAQQMAGLTTGAVERLRQQETLLAEGLVRSLANGEALCGSLRAESDRLGRLSVELREQNSAIVGQIESAGEGLASRLSDTAAEALGRMTEIEARGEALARSLESQSSLGIAAMTESMARADESLSGRLDELGKEALKRIEALQGRGRQALQGLDTLAEQRIEGLVSALDSARDQLDSKLTCTAAAAGARIDAIEERCATLLGSLAEDGDAQAQAVTDAIVAARKGLAAAFADAADEAERRVGDLDTRCRALLTTLTEGGGTSVQAVDAAMLQAGEALEQHLAGVTAEAEARLGALEARCAALATSLAASGTAPVQEVEAAVVRARSALDEQGRRLAVAGETAVGRAEEARAAYSQLEAVFAEKDAAVLDQIESMDAALKTRGETLTATAQSIGATVEQTLRRLSAEGAHLDQTLGATRQAADQLRTRIESEAETLAELQDKLNRTLEGLAVRFEAQTKLLGAAADASAASSKTYLEASGSEMEALRVLQQEAREGLIELQHRAAATLGELSGSIEQTRRNAQSLDDDLGQRTERYETVMRESYARSTAFAEAFAKQAEALTRASRLAEDQIEALTSSREQSQRDAFLRSATLLIEDLNSLAIDMTRLLEEDIPEDVWRSYRKGDRSAFARRLLRMRDQFSVPAVERRFREDEDFRIKASRFMTQFETLLTQASQCDGDQVLNAAFLTADVGKVYLLLSRSLGREQ